MTKEFNQLSINLSNIETFEYGKSKDVVSEREVLNVTI